MKLSLSHFEAALLLALVASIVLGIVGRRTDRERMRHTLVCLGYFMGALFGLAWLMYLGHR